LALIGLGSNDSPSGNTPFADNGMALIGARGSGGRFGYATTFAQLIGAVGSNQPEGALVPVGQFTTFRSGNALGSVAPIVDTLSAGWPNQAIPWGAPAATFEIVAWDNASGLYPTWAEAAWAWEQGIIAAGHSAPFTVTQIGGDIPPDLNNDQGGTNGMTSFNLYYTLSVYPAWPATLPASDITATSATLNGTVNLGSEDSLAWFQWGTTDGYGNATPLTDMGTGRCTCPLPFSAPLTSLTPGTTYHFGAMASNIVGPAYGRDQTFTTPFLPLIIKTGNGYWDVGSSTLRYYDPEGSGGGPSSFILLQSADPMAPLGAWTRVATNHSIPGTFSIPHVGTAGSSYYRVKRE
jgi:hypothetical protein